MAAQASSIELDGRTLRITNRDKVMYPETGTTKGDVIDYYAAVARWMVPHVAGRPATRKRWVHGVEAHAFFSKNADSGTPDWVRTVTMQHSRDALRYPVIDDASTLVFLAQLAALEIHVPQWRFGPDGTPAHPDRLVLDLDPGEGAGMAECVEVALIIKEILDGVGLVSVPVTSGSKGIHLYAGLDGHLSSAEASDVARQLALALQASHPGLVVADMKKDLRGGKVLLDWSQNNGAKTTVSPYSLRGRAHPYVAAPRTWDEIAPGLGQLTYTDVLARLASIGDPLSVLLPDAAASDRLATYRAKRDADRTPEPVPAAGPSGATPGNSFVIQEHHARRLHHDFRLERDGVLVSWALPKLTPLVPRENRLAVQTEDHPLEYGSFAGTIPAGEYGGGEVTIWDAGTFETEKWSGREVMVTLRGRPDGGLGGVPRRFVLIHAAQGGDPKNWLIHLMDAPAGAPTRAEPAQPPKTAEIGPNSTLSGLSSSSADARGRRVWALADLPSVEPMLATVSSEAEVTGDDWHYEVKWDGYRGIAVVAGGELRLGSRRGIDFTATYPELRELVEVVGAHAAVLDGEIVALGPDGRSHFELLQNHGSGVAAAHYMAFDLLWLDGESLLERPYLERRAALEGLMGGGGRFVHVPSTFGDDRELALTASRDLELEGLIAKRPGGTYAPGRRSRTWLKIKNVREMDVVVVGWAPGEGSRAGTVGALLVALAEQGGLVYVGRAGSGFTDRGLGEALALLAPLERPDAPVAGVPARDARGVHWVEPRLVGRVSYGDRTASGVLRHPVWRGWRPPTTRSPQ